MLIKLEQRDKSPWKIHRILNIIYDLLC